MNWSFWFFFESALMGAALAMDAFSVSAANGLNEPKMSGRKMLAVAGMFALFQSAMPLIGWFCVHTVAEYFEAFETAIPWIALILLSFIGGKMLLDGIRCKCEEGPCCTSLGFGALAVQGIATSIDALSVGFTIAEYDWLMALTAALVIGAVTFGICLGGVQIGKSFGTRLSGKASVFGGVILIAIGLEIFISGVFF
ncbi:MAG: manganese efflux pump [Clostridia bacterium]|nr:manganese efflux pump [Clostridia bacterium]